MGKPVRTMAPNVLKHPPVKVQSNPLHCWAASLESWLAATARVTIGQKDLVAKYSPHPGGGLNARQDFPRISHDFNMGFSFWTLPSRRGVNPTFSPDLVDSMIRHHNYLYLVYPVGGGFSHAIIVYGISRPLRDEPRYHIMDPEKGRGLQEVSMSSFFPEVDWVLVAWPGLGN